jgi:hypothetical protein
MEEVEYQELIIVCEGCHTVKKMPIHEYDECRDLFKQFHCPNGCGHNLHSYFTIGQLRK